MSQRGIDFATGWLTNHLHDEPYHFPEGMIDDTVAQLTAAARAAGVPVAEIEEDMGPLHAFIASEYERLTEEEDERLSHGPGHG